MEGEAQEHKAMEFKEKEEEEVTEPVSPTGQYFNSSVLSICVLAVLESEVPIDDSLTMTLLKDVFLPINPRFSSIMVNDKNGEKQWKRVEVQLQNHVNIPIFPIGLSTTSYDSYFNDYISRIALKQFPQSQPLWEIHLVKYPTSKAAGNIIFKLHHALGDGFSLMGALLSCLQRADNPSLSLTFPSLQFPSNPDCSFSKLNITVPKCISSIFNTISDFGWSLLKSSFVEDSRSPIRSGDEEVRFKPIVISTITFSLDHIKQIKSRLGVTINDVITGIIFYGTRLYMQNVDDKSTNAHSTALVLLNTRVISGYRSVKEMVKPDAESPWGNQFGFLHVSVPELTDSRFSKPLECVTIAQEIIQRKRSSLAVNLTGRLLEVLRKIRGPEATAKYIKQTLFNSSMTISNIIGPVDKMALANHPIKGFYFMVVGVPQSLTITMVSYAGKLRVAVGTEKGFMDSQKFKSCMETAFEMIFKSSCEGSK
ncbi:wax ester synthase/diacylglycerol acyltransferase 4-like [Populus nigra]|uniref:wax ester synthase/diacylglycerol acyltransferase 4-like n=1 Tax=Populus nigra TaxID=3691 RepID=UPI002B2683C0|nr:wax ester synthase/diacylglycerol acyltransferase 4-like [Populus nigra]